MELTFSSRVGTLPTIWTTEQPGSRVRWSTIECSVRPHEIPTTSSASRLCVRSSAHARPSCSRLNSSVPSIVRTTIAPLRPWRAASSSDRSRSISGGTPISIRTIPSRRAAIQKASHLETRYAQLRGDLALAGAVQKVTAGGDYRIQAVHSQVPQIELTTESVRSTLELTCPGPHVGTDDGGDPISFSFERQ